MPSLGRPPGCLCQIQQCRFQVGLRPSGDRRLQQSRPPRTWWLGRARTKNGAIVSGRANASRRFAPWASRRRSCAHRTAHSVLGAPQHVSCRELRGGKRHRNGNAPTAQIVDASLWALGFARGFVARDTREPSRRPRASATFLRHALAGHPRKVSGARDWLQRRANAVLLWSRAHQRVKLR